MPVAGHTLVLNEKGKKVGVSVAYPPANLYHILFELFKNSMRATVETHYKALKLPKIEVLLAKGEHDVSIRISDQVISHFCQQHPKSIACSSTLHMAGWRDTATHHRPDLPLSGLNGTQTLL